MKAIPSRLRRVQTALVFVDFQERLLPAMTDSALVLQNAVRLAQAGAILGVPAWVTEQYPKGLGPTAPDLARAVAGFAPVDKVVFSACEVAGWTDALTARDIADVVLGGIEAHVCVCQTGLDLLDRGFRVFAVADAMSSRTQWNLRFGVERLRDAGATIVTTEMVLFELLERAGTAEFKAVQALVK